MHAFASSFDVKCFVVLTLSLLAQLAVHHENPAAAAAAAGGLLMHPAAASAAPHLKIITLAG